MTAFAPRSQVVSPRQRVDLPGVTLIAATSVALPATVRALEQCIAQIRFGAVLLLSDRRPDLGHNSEIVWRQIAPFDSRHAYSSFMLQALHQHVETSHALCVQWDGYVIDAARWNPAFLDYDYVGAPWPHFSDGMTVGNGGFSLRSHRLLQACSSLELAAGQAEDVAICREFRPLLELTHNIRFAPEEIARTFAYERYPTNGNEFGFHGVFNMVKTLAPAELRRLLDGLEARVIHRSELLELIWWAIGHGEARIALELARRLSLNSMATGRMPRSEDGNT